MIKTHTMRRALHDPELLGNALPGDSWFLWSTLLIAAVGEPLITEEEREAFRSVTERDPPPGAVKEFVCVVGRRGGKDRAISVLNAWLLTCCKYPMLARGEVGRIVVVAPSQQQARFQLGYVVGVLEGSPKLRGLVTGSTADSVEVGNLLLEVRAANFRNIRGMTCLAVVCTESAFWLSSAEVSNPDVEIIGALKPTLHTTNGMMI